MSKKYTISIILTICLFSLLPGQETNFPQLKSGDLSNWEIVDTRSFVEKELYGHINGGAEVYHEYGFKKLVVQEISNGNVEFTLEIYQMKNPLAAFGIYSISHRDCPSVAGLPRFSCQNQFQLQTIKGRYYLSITNYVGNEQLQKLSNQIGKIILTKIEDKNFQIPAIYNGEMLENQLNNLKFIRGNLGVQNGIPDWYNFFADVSFNHFYVLPFHQDKLTAHISWIEFQSQSEVQNFSKKFNLNIKKSDWQRYKSNNIYAIYGNHKTQMLFVETSLVNDTILKLLNHLENQLNQFQN